MSNPWYHAHSSAKRFGGKPEDYLAIHEWFDESKRSFADYRHRALRHHSEGIFEAVRYFGDTITISTCAKIPTRLIGEQHVLEDLQWIPSLKDWLKCIHSQPWMREDAKLLFRKEVQVLKPPAGLVPDLGELP